MKKAAIVGYGAIGPIHALALEKTQKARLYAVCDTDPERRRLCREQYGALEYEDFDTMLADPEIDSVHICTPHYLHYEMIRNALAAGKTVVAEKPVTRTRQEWEALLALPGANRVCVVLQNRLNPCVQKLKRLAGQMGHRGRRAADQPGHTHAGLFQLYRGGDQSGQGGYVQSYAGENHRGGGYSGCPSGIRGRRKRRLLRHQRLWGEFRALLRDFLRAGHCRIYKPEAVGERRPGRRGCPGQRREGLLGQRPRTSDRQVL